MLVLGTSLAPASVVPLTVEQMVAVADEIHTVQVLGSTTEVFEGKILTRQRVKVLESFKGELRGETDIVQLGGRRGPLAMQVDDIPMLKEGDTAVLFMSYPLRRLPQQERARFNQASPLVTAPQFVGGFQGHFSVQTAAVEGAGTLPAETRALRALRGASVRRTAAMSMTAGDGREPVADYSRFASEIRSLVAEEMRLRSTRTAPVRIGGIRGEFHVPARRKDSDALRVFDPLPSIAYASPEEIEAARARVRAEAEGRADKAQPDAKEETQKTEDRP
jgi:hypothetical protein